MTQLPALLFVADGQLRFELGTPPQLDARLSFLRRHFPEFQPRIAIVEIRIVEDAGA